MGKSQEKKENKFERANTLDPRQFSWQLGITLYSAKWFTLIHASGVNDIWCLRDDTIGCCFFLKSQNSCLSGIVHAIFKISVARNGLSTMSFWILMYNKIAYVLEKQNIIENTFSFMRMNFLNILLDR